MLGWVAAAYSLAVAVCQVPMGRLADIYGSQKVFVIGLVLVVITAFLCAISNSALMLILFRSFHGVGASMMFSTMLVILTSVFPAGERGKALGVFSAAVNVGLAIGPFLGGVLTEHFGWRSIFYFTVLVGVVAAGLTFWKLKSEWAAARGESFDIIGAIALGVSIAVGIYGFSVLPTLRGIILVVVGILVVLAFVRWESKMGNPILNVGLFRKNTVFVFSNLAMLISFAATYAITFLVSLYLQYTKGLSPQSAGFVLVILPVIIAIIAPMAGRLSDVIEARKVASVGLALSCISLVLFSFLGEETTLGFVIIGLVIISFGNGLFASPNTNTVMGSVEKRFLGVASGVWGTMRTSGMVMSLSIVMILFSLYIGKAEITPEYYPAFLASTKMGFKIFAVLCFGAIFA